MLTPANLWVFWCLVGHLRKFTKAATKHSSLVLPLVSPAAGFAAKSGESGWLKIESSCCFETSRLSSRPTPIAQGGSSCGSLTETGLFWLLGSRDVRACSSSCCLARRGLSASPAHSLSCTGCLVLAVRAPGLCGANCGKREVCR